MYDITEKRTTHLFLPLSILLIKFKLIFYITFKQSGYNNPTFLFIWSDRTPPHDFSRKGCNSESKPTNNFLTPVTITSFVVTLSYIDSF